jgi:hypothetical protein
LHRKKLCIAGTYIDGTAVAAHHANVAGLEKKIYGNICNLECGTQPDGREKQARNKFDTRSGNKISL